VAVVALLVCAVAAVAIVSSRKSTRQSYTPPLTFHFLTPLFDTVLAWTCREATFKARVVRLAAPGAQHKVLDVGCGTGTLMHHLASAAPLAELHGVDPDGASLEIARRKLSSLPSTSTVQLRTGYANALPFADGSLTTVVSTLVFHQVQTHVKRESFREIHRVLARDGEFILADWGAPQNVLMRVMFFLVQTLDGFVTTADNVNGRIPQMLGDAGFVVTHESDVATVFGTLSIWRARKAA
jgi:SAM-dependent methyltransferase